MRGITSYTCITQLGRAIHSCRPPCSPWLHVYMCAAILSDRLAHFRIGNQQYLGEAEACSDYKREAAPADTSG